MNRHVRLRPAKRRIGEQIQRVLAFIPLLAGAAALGCQPSPPPHADVTAPSANTPITPVALLDAMDSRKPVPLLPMMANHQKENMRGHLVAVQKIVAGLAADDFGGIERASLDLGFSDQMGKMCSHMGAGAPGFTEQALAFHHTADTIGVAARAHDKVAVTKALNDTLQTCTSCHATWKQQVVDDGTWKEKTGSASPTGMHK